MNLVELPNEDMMAHFATYITALHVKEQHENDNKPFHEIENGEDTSFWVNWYQLNSFAF